MAPIVPEIAILLSLRITIRFLFKCPAWLSASSDIPAPIAASPTIAMAFLSSIPFILSGYLIQRFLVFSRNFKKNTKLVSKIGGITLLITGVLILTNKLQILGYYILNAFPLLQNFG